VHKKCTDTKVGEYPHFGLTHFTIENPALDWMKLSLHQALNQITTPIEQNISSPSHAANINRFEYQSIKIPLTSSKFLTIANIHIPQ